MTYNKLIINEDFESSVADYLYLIEKRYSRKSSLKIVGDRYRLNSDQRSVLQRGVIKRKIALERERKFVKEENLFFNCLIIDCYNVLITIISYLTGKFLYISNDGFLRDTSETHSNIKKFNLNTVVKAFYLIFEYLKELDLSEVIFFLDSPVSNSVKLSNKINILLEINNLDGYAQVVKSADHYIINASDGIAATSDSVVIDKKMEVFDLACHVLKYHYEPDFFNLKNLIDNNEKKYSELIL
ncbi:MAG: DUF434 domain-containing protein [Spirochaetes bacterium]|nr:DUF434 domain-containing protein [Spirochaetota bacterium]